MKTEELFGCDLSTMDTKSLKNKLKLYRMLSNKSSIVSNKFLFEQTVEFHSRVEAELLHRKEIFIDDEITPKKTFEKFREMSRKR